MINNYKQIFSREQIMTILKNSIKRNANSNNKNQAKSTSAYGQKLRESKKISLFYGGLSKKYLQKINEKSIKEPSKLSENIFLILESRLDVVLYRSGFFDSIKSAKQMVRVGGIKVNNKIVISPGFFVTPGDILSVFGKRNRKNLCHNIDRLPQKNVFFVNQRHLKKNGDAKQSHIGISSKEKINICKTFAKIKNQIPSRKGIVSRYKSSQMLLSTISLAFAYSRMLRACKNNISNITTNINNTKNQIVQSFSVASLRNTSEQRKPPLITSTYFDRNRSRTLREKSFALTIEKDNGFGLCLIFINTIKSLINHRDLRKSHNDQSQKTVAFLNRLITFNKDIPEKHLDILFMFLNYLLNLKKQLSFLQKKKINYKKQQHTLFFKNQYFFEVKKTKVPHLEVSYKSLSIIFLFPPQRVNFPFFLNPSLIYK